MNWQPIDTAPKDGTAILGYCPEDEGVDKFAIVLFLCGCWMGNEEDGFCIKKPAHWMPLPEPPTKEQ